ncbi:heterodisulfide reductase subunit B [Desulfohalotomaculum tongense]|uniref:CoB--CoM heterodisulfide reductase iron-sulfur subunit B family protein n=1 Tax=Desulforadius tongensis TaxID=1216062 RepID=UPI00195BCA11|nr:CoB--CoM heterodisulfide reductase iron-sulfur subunit B family protein [Desulforadius tongensis]MBM7856136.1 heterodisulfide reductase subunit B [Desulforadius tongensis]
MKYNYFPGCASEGTALANYHAFLAVAKKLGIELNEIEDWNCCGATVTSSVIGEFPAQVLAARNLALAEKQQRDTDIVTTCSSCYAILGLTNNKFADEEFKKKANEALKEDELEYTGNLNVRFLLDVLVNDIGVEKIEAAAEKPLKGLKVAGYVGCQSVKALRGHYDDPEYPESLDKIIRALGAEAVEFENSNKCCTGALALTAPEITVSAVHPIIDGAAKAGADLIVTPCPLCQMNLDAYQAKANKQFQTNNNLPVLFITQLMALAFGLSRKEAGLDYCIVSPYQKLSNWV